MRKLKFILVLAITPFFLNLAYANPIVLHGDKASSKVKHAIYVRYNDRSPLPQLVRFDPGNPMRGYAFSTWLDQFFKKGVKPGFNLVHVRRDQYGYVHKKYQEIVNGYPVQYGVIQAHIKNGYMSTYSGELYPTNVNTASASISETNALNKALAYMNADQYMWEIPGNEIFIKKEQNNPNATFKPKGKLVYIYKNNVPGKQFRLAYRFNIYAAKPLSRKMIWVDAQTGEIINTNNLIKHANSTGSANTLYSGSQTITSDHTGGHYRLYETNRAGGVKIRTMNIHNLGSMQQQPNYNNATEFTSNSSNWNLSSTDQPALDAHWGAEKVVDYYWNKFNRNGITGSGGTVYGFVHYGNNMANAFWDGQYMNYGDGGQGLGPVVALDVAGHEMTHGVVQHTAGFANGEAAALNESFADCFGNTVEHFAKPSQASWWIGEDLVSSGGIRNMEDPNSQSIPRPDTYQGQNWNYGGGDPHFQGCPHDYYYYLIVEGGSGTNYNNDSYNVTGIGWDKGMRILYRNLTTYLSPNSDYADARAGAIQAATDLYGDCSQAVVTVTNAYYAIGVGNQYSGGAVVSDFTASPKSSCAVPFTVTFTNTGSTGNGNTYNWDFGDGNTSTSENPTHTYTSFGQYDVSLTTTPSSQSCGSDNETKNNYIDADPNNSCFSCDTINYPLPGTLSIYGAQSGGYLAGWNGNGDKADANQFTNYGSYTHVTGALIGFYGVYDNGDGAQVNVSIWADNNGSPGNKLKTITVSLQNLESALSYAGGTHQGVVQFSFPDPVAVSSPYYLGIEMVGFTANDSLGVISNKDGDSPTDMMWELGQNNTWNKYSEVWQNATSLDLYISPIMTETPPDAIITSNQTSTCAGGSIHFDGSGSQNVEDGGYSWEFPGGSVTTSTDSVLNVNYPTAGTYNAILHVIGGCSGISSDTIPIVINPSPTITVSSTTDPAVCGGNGTINLTFTGVSDGNYTISYNGGTFTNVTVSGGTASISAAGGSYNNMKITDGGCSSPNGVNASISDPGALPQPNISIDPATCSANGNATISNYNSSNNYNFTPSGPTVGNGGVISNATVGTSYTVVVTSGSCNSPQETFTVPAQLPSPAVPTVNTNAATCAADGSASISNYSSSNNYTFSPSGPTIGNGGAISNASTGTNYTVTASSGGCTSNTTSFNVQTQLPSPAVPTVNTNAATCTADGSASISNYSSSNNYTFSPSGPTIGNGGAISNASAGTNYTVTASSGGCTSNTVSFNVQTQLSSPAVPTVNTNAATCTADGSASISNYSSSNNYTFSPSGPTIGNGGAISNASAGTNYTVTASSGGCTSNTASFNVQTQLPAPLIAVSSTTPPSVCGGNGTIQLVLTGVSNGNYTISYDGGMFTNVSVSGGTATISTPAGSYNNLTINNGTCSSASGVNASFSDPSAPATPSLATVAATCSNDGSASISNYNASNNYTFTPAGPTINSSGDIMNATLGTSYTVMTSAGACHSSSTSFTINAQLSSPTVSATATSTSICDGESTSLSASGASNYTWDNSLGSGGTQSVHPTTTTTYQVTGTATNGCTATDQVTITVNPGITVTVSASETTVCDGTPATLTASGANTYSWNNGLGTGSTQTVNPSATTTYVVTGTSSGCTNQASITINVGQSPDVQVTPVNVSICEGETTTLLATGADSYVWTPSSSLNTSTGSSVIASPLTNTTYQVTGTNNCGTDVKSINVTVNASPTVPVITQNGNVLSVTLAAGETAKWFHNSSLVGNGAQYTITESGDYKVVIINANGCTAQATGTFQADDAGLASNKLKQLNIYPNPTNGVLTIDWGTIQGVQKIRVYDMIGKQVFAAPVSSKTNKQSINLSRFEKGIYVVRLVTKNNTISRKITKQ